MDKRKILVVCDPNSIHASRFVNLLQEIGYDTRVFQCEFFYNIDEFLSDTLTYVYLPYNETKNILSNFTLVDYFFKKFNLSVIKKYFYKISRYKVTHSKDIELFSAKRLNKVINNWKPDLLFSLKLQNDGYVVSKLKTLLKTKLKPKWIHFCWGTDIEFFGKNDSFKNLHLKKIQNSLGLCDFFISDCLRDYKQAEKFGLSGKKLGYFAANGGFDINYIKKIRQKFPLNERRIILIKGREGGLVGRAFLALEALHNVSKLLNNFKILIIMPTENIKNVASFLTKIDNINYEIAGRLSYNSLLEIFAQTLISISASDIDGSPGFLIESIAMGAFPIHSDGLSIREWIKNGENGLLFKNSDVLDLENAIVQALNNPELINNARDINWDITLKRLDRKKIGNFLLEKIENDVFRNN